MSSQPSYFVKGEVKEVAGILGNFFDGKYSGKFKFKYFDFERWADKKMPNSEDVESMGTINGMPDMTGKTTEQISRVMAGIVFFNDNCVAGLMTYKSKPGEVKVIPALSENNGYIFDEKDMEIAGLEISEKVLV